jgi:hypothetical protein
MKTSKLSLGLLTLGVLFVTVNGFAMTPPVPDASSSAFLLTLGFAGLAAVRKLIR